MKTVNFLFAAGVVLGTLEARGQEGPNLLQFSFSNPGARSLGLAGAFAALADDATAAFANPAGLVQLTRPEVSVEGRSWSYSTPFTNGGRVSGQPTGILIDTTTGLRIGESSNDLSGISFLSYVYPRPRFSIAFYRHQLANFETSSETEGLFAEDLPGFPGATRFNDLRQTSDLEAASFGLAAAWRLRDDFSIGLGLIYTQVDFVSLTDGFNHLPGPEGFFGENPFSPELLDNRNTLHVDDQDVTISGGFLWHLSDRWSLGGFYRAGSNLTIDSQFVAGPDSGSGLPAGTVLFETSSRVDLPNVFGLGVAVRSPGGAATLAFEWDRVEYSTIISSLETEVSDQDLLTIDDADELRVGFEYAILRASPLVALRAGWWLDPDHRIRSLESNPIDRALLPAGDDQAHLTFGVGVAFRSLQIDLGVDVSELIDTVALSVIYNT